MDEMQIFIQIFLSGFDIFLGFCILWILYGMVCEIRRQTKKGYIIFIRFFVRKTYKKENPGDYYGDLIINIFCLGVISIPMMGGLFIGIFFAVLVVTNNQLGIQHIFLLAISLFLALIASYKIKDKLAYNDVKQCEIFDKMESTISNKEFDRRKNNF